MWIQFVGFTEQFMYVQVHSTFSVIGLFSHRNLFFLEKIEKCIINIFRPTSDKKKGNKKWSDAFVIFS